MSIYAGSHPHTEALMWAWERVAFDANVETRKLNAERLAAWVLTWRAPDAVVPVLPPVEVPADAPSSLEECMSRLGALPKPARTNKLATPVRVEAAQAGAAAAGAVVPSAAPAAMPSRY